VGAAAPGRRRAAVAFLCGGAGLSSPQSGGGRMEKAGNVPCRGHVYPPFHFSNCHQNLGKQKFPNFWELIRKFGKTEIAKFPEFEFSEKISDQKVSLQII
jgi:hypothetical protein